MTMTNPDDITIWLRDQDEAGCHEAADIICQLPEGRYCSECIFLAQCVAFGTRATDKVCQWFPCRFTPHVLPTSVPTPPSTEG